MNIEIIYKYIKVMSLSILQLSRLCNMADISLGKVIHGKTKNSRIDTIVKIAEALEISDNNLLILCKYIRNNK